MIVEELYDPQTLQSQSWYTLPTQVLHRNRSFAVDIAARHGDGNQRRG